MSPEALAVKKRIDAARRHLLYVRRWVPRVRWDSDHVELLTEDVQEAREVLAALERELRS
jgi:L-rhamnose isomerase